MHKSLVILFISCLLYINAFGETIKLHENYPGDYLNFSGDGQTQNINEDLDNPLKVYVTNESNQPIANHNISFKIYSIPSGAKSYSLHNKIVKSDSLGIAQTGFTIGDKSGEYRITVQSLDNPDSNILIYTVYGREKSWMFFMIIGLIGGLAIFLYGLDIMSKGMQASAGDKMRSLIGKLTFNRFFALLSGIIITVMLSSSSAASVMLVGFVQAGLMNFVQSLGILLGAGIGTTITAQLIAMNIADYSLLIVAVGFGIMIFTKKVRQNNIGKSILGIGLLFFGMLIMSQAMYPLRSYDGFINFLINLENPLIGILVGFLFTALIQSSAAFIGIMITLATQGFISLEASIPLVLGTNLGTGITAILASLNSNREAKKVAFAHTLFKGIGVLFFIWWIPEFAELLRKLSGTSISEVGTIENMSKDVPRQIANAHTVFSLSLAILLLPFTNLIGKLINRILPVRIYTEKEVFELKHIKIQLNSSPAIALSLAKKETERMSENVQEMLRLSLKPFMDRDASVLHELQKLENKIDFLKENIKKYLISISTENTDEERLNEAFQIMYVIKELEMIADIINTNIRHQASKWFTLKAEFSAEGKEELRTIHLKALKQISRSMEVFHDLNLERAEQVRKKQKKYALMAETYEKHHYERLIHKREDSISSSEVHLELLGLYNAVIRHATNIARIFITCDSVSESENKK
jgi:phosphate:Na+ symporter